MKMPVTTKRHTLRKHHSHCTPNRIVETPERETESEPGGWSLVSR